jgi:hypothetical protein
MRLRKQFNKKLNNPDLSQSGTESSAHRVAQSLTKHNA